MSDAELLQSMLEEIRALRTTCAERLDVVEITLFGDKENIDSRPGALVRLAKVEEKQSESSISRNKIFDACMAILIAVVSTAATIGVSRTMTPSSPPAQHADK